jgi:hypothetical protein
MSLSDKILILLEKYGALSSERVTFLLDKEYKQKRDIRTVQRHISILVREGKICPTNSTGRQQIYSLLKLEPLTIAVSFISRVWDELFELRNKLHYPENQRARNLDVLYELRSLVQMFPHDMKDRIMPLIENFPVFGEEEKKKIIQEVQRNVGTAEILTVNGVPFGEEEIQRKAIAQEIIGQAHEKKLEEIIGAVSSMLHEALKEKE